MHWFRTGEKVRTHFEISRGLDYHCRLEEKDRETLMGGLEVEANNVMDPFSPFPSWNRFLLVALCGWRR